MSQAQHEFPAGDGKRWCKWCGALWHAEMTATCLERPAEATPVRPAPQRRQLACEDGDAITGRIAELRKAREAAWNTPAAEAAPAAAAEGEWGGCCA